MSAQRSTRCRRNSPPRSRTSPSSSATSIPRIPICSGSTRGRRCRSARARPRVSFPTRSRIYRLPLEESFPDPDELEDEIRITVLHELAHYFGIDEERLEQLGYG